MSKETQAKAKKAADAKAAKVAAEKAKSEQDAKDAAAKVAAEKAKSEQDAKDAAAKDAAEKSAVEGSEEKKDAPKAISVIIFNGGGKGVNVCHAGEYIDVPAYGKSEPIDIASGDSLEKNLRRFPQLSYKSVAEVEEESAEEADSDSDKENGE